MHELAVAPFPTTSPNPEVLDAMAMLARETGLVVHVVAPREPGLLTRARDIAERGGLQVGADLMPNTLRVRFSA